MKKVTLIALFIFISVCFLSAQSTDNQSITKATTSLKDYCGVYKMSDNPYVEEVKIECKDGKLTSKTPDDEDIVFEYTEEDSFYIPTINATAIFTRDKGHINAVKVMAGGKEYVGSKK
jgi:hypothetical protein